MSAVRKASSSVLGARSVHLRIVPRPANLAESREILRVLKGFGDVDVFKWLKYEYHNPIHNIALAIFRKDDAAKRALDASPLRFALERTVNVPIEDLDGKHEVDEQDDATTDTDPSSQPTHDTIDDILRPSTLSTRIPPTTKTQPASPSPGLPYSPQPHTSTTTIPRLQTRHFQIIIDRSHTIHADFVSRQPFWKYFSPMKCMAQIDLAKKVPHIGLSDVSKRPPNAHRTPNKVLRGINTWLERGMPRIRDLGKSEEEVEGGRDGVWGKKIKEEG